MKQLQTRDMEQMQSVDPDALPNVDSLPRAGNKYSQIGTNGMKALIDSLLIGANLQPRHAILICDLTGLWIHTFQAGFLTSQSIRNPILLFQSFSKPDEMDWYDRELVEIMVEKAKAKELKVDGIQPLLDTAMPEGMEVVMPPRPSLKRCKWTKPQSGNIYPGVRIQGCDEQYFKGTKFSDEFDGVAEAVATEFGEYGEDVTVKGEAEPPTKKAPSQTNNIISLFLVPIII